VLLAAADRLSAAGEDLGRLLQHGHPEQELLELARLFWEQLLTSGSRSLAGFGWMAEVEALEDATWLQLTRRTLEVRAGVLDWSQAMADRAGEAAPSAESLDILNLLVRMPGNLGSNGRLARRPWQFAIGRGLCETRLNIAGWIVPCASTVSCSSAPATIPIRWSISSTSSSCLNSRRPPPHPQT